MLFLKQGSRKNGLFNLNFNNVAFTFLLLISFILLLSRNSHRDVNERSVDYERVKFLPSKSNNEFRKTKKPKEPLRDNILEVSNLEGFKSKKDNENASTTVPSNKLGTLQQNNSTVQQNPVEDEDENEDKITESEEEFDMDEEFHPPTNNNVYKTVGEAFQKVFKRKKKEKPLDQNGNLNSLTLNKFDGGIKQIKAPSSDKPLVSQPLSKHYQANDKISDNSDKEVKSSLPDRYREIQLDSNPKIIKIERDKSVENTNGMNKIMVQPESNQSNKVVINKLEKVTSEEISSVNYETKSRSDFTPDDEDGHHHSQADRSFNEEQNRPTNNRKIGLQETTTGEKKESLFLQMVSEALRNPERNASEKEIRTLFEIISRRRKLSLGATQCSNLTPVGVNTDDDLKFHPDQTQYFCEDADFFDHFRRKCIIYSFGVNNNWQFEKMAADRGCKVWVFDVNIKEKPADIISPNIYFFNYGLGTRNEVRFIQNQEVQFYSLEEIIKQNHHQKSSLSYLKMNLNGEEWQILDQITEESSLITNNILQMGLTFHLHAALSDHYLYNQYLRILNKLFGLGFQLFTSKEVEIPNESYNEPMVDNKLVTLTNYLAFLRV